MCTHLKMVRASVNFDYKSRTRQMINSLWGHPEHQGGEEHRHDAKKERDFLPGLNDLGRVPRRRELR
jgi:hypothetical protein